MYNVKVLLVFVFIIWNGACSFRCDRRPYGSTTKASQSDGRFQLKILNNYNNAYIPEQLYTVQVSATDDDSQFTAFMISAEGDSKVDPRNPRKTISLYPGDLRPQNPATAKFSDRCLYTVEQVTITSKSSIEVYWFAPPSGNGCVTLRAMVVENDEMWFEDGTPLTQKLCEDLRQPDDIAPAINENCDICDEAKYELSFTGIWSRNTHPRLYPENDWVPRFSDIVGASHSIDYILWSPGILASEGLRNLAEHANSSKLEEEIREKIGDGVRTLVKGKGHGYRKMNNPTYAFFRANKDKHLISSVVAIHPSPDWFLGVTRFELCQDDNTWLQERELNLYLWDAGTDSGISYESPNIVTFPQDAVSRVELSSYDKHSPFYETNMEDLHPFGKLHIKLIRTYHRNCEETPLSPPTTTQSPITTEESVSETTTEVTTTVTEELPDIKPEEPEPPSRYQNLKIDSGDAGREKPLVSDPDPKENCPLSEWDDWSPCEGPCEDGIVRGYKWRERYHLVDGIAVEKYDPTARHASTKEVSRYCKSHYEVFQQNYCEENCEESEESDEEHITMERRVMQPLLPGASWRTKKRGVAKSIS